MSDEKQKPELRMVGADPKLPFYITSTLHTDGSLDVSSEGMDPLSLDAATARAKEMIEEYGDEAIFVVECRVVRKLYRGKVRVEPIKSRATR